MLKPYLLSSQPTDIGYQGWALLWLGNTTQYIRLTVVHNYLIKELPDLPGCRPITNGLFNYGANVVYAENIELSSKQVVNLV